MSSSGNAIALAQYFTPPAVARFTWDAVRTLASRDLGPEARVIDPAAGEGALLAAVGGAGVTTGIELDAALAERGGAVADRFYIGDGLLATFPKVRAGGFDCVVANPPFGKLYPVLSKLDSSFEKTLRQRFKSIELIGTKSLDAFPIEVLFIERALELVRPKGWISLILPESFFANSRLQGVRDWLLERAEVRAVVGLPGSAFRRKGLNARTALVVLRRRDGRPAMAKARLVGGADEDLDLETSLQRALRQLRSSARKQTGMGAIHLGQETLMGQRWDPRYWQGHKALKKLSNRLNLVPLGDYIDHLTYGPIITGSRPGHVASGIPVIRQGDIVETGLDEEDLLRVQPEGRHDPPRSRVRAGDLLLPRSGAGALGRNRLAVYLGAKPANVGCFVDLIRLEGLNPFYTWFFFKTAWGREQIAACANGVGTPNISFGEIRALQIAVLPLGQQRALERRYRREVWPLHRRRSESEAICAEAERRFGAIVGDLEGYLKGTKRRLVG